MSLPVEKCIVSAKLAGVKVQRFRFGFAGRKVQSRDYGRTLWFVFTRCTECRYMKMFVVRF
jgi:hypothetical protein